MHFTLFAVFQAALHPGGGERERAQNIEPGRRQREGRGRKRGVQGPSEPDQPDGDVGGRERGGAEQDAVRQHGHVPLVPLQGPLLLPHGQAGGRHDRAAGKGTWLFRVTIQLVNKVGFTTSSPTGGTPPKQDGGKWKISNPSQPNLIINASGLELSHQVLHFL